MKEGKIEANGVENIKAIATLIEDQIVSYNFQYYHQDLPTNVAVLILGNGRSMFKNSIHMPALCTNVQLNEVKNKVNQVIADKDNMDQMRKFFLALAYHHDKSIGDFNIPS